MPNQEIFYPSVHLVDDKTTRLLWGHILVGRKRQQFDLLSVIFFLLNLKMRKSIFPSWHSLQTTKSLESVRIN